MVDDGADDVGRTCDEGGAGVDGALADAASLGAGAERLAVQRHVFKVDEPVVGHVQRHILHGTGVVLGVAAAHDHDAAVSAGLLGQVEREQVLLGLDQARVDQGLPVGRDALDGNAGPSHADDTVELSEEEREALLGDDFGEALLRHRETLDAARGDGVERQSAVDLTATVGNVDRGPVVLVGGGLGRIELLVEEARDGLAVLARDPDAEAAAEAEEEAKEGESAHTAQGGFSRNFFNTRA